jgi:hypothetical protein
MNDPLQNLFAALKPTNFPPNSRYANLQTATLETPDGRVTLYLRRRFVPPADRFAEIQQYTVSQGERIDLLASKLIGDPERFWQLCDANNAMTSDDLTETPGRTIRVTLPEGIPGGNS